MKEQIKKATKDQIIDLVLDIQHGAEGEWIYQGINAQKQVERKQEKDKAWTDLLVLLAKLEV